jgi:hypothetical protein
LVALESALKELEIDSVVALFEVQEVYEAFPVTLDTVLVFDGVVTT